MQRGFISLFICLLTLTLVVACVPEKPVKDGKGELAVTIDRQFTAPVTHSPLDWWQTRHFQVIDAGDIPEKDCLYCHKVETSCNNCHGYVGVRKIQSTVDSRR